MSNYVLDQYSPLESAENIYALAAVKTDGQGGAVSLEAVAFEASKFVGDAVKVATNALPEMGEINKSAIVFGGPGGRVLSYNGQTYPVTKDHIAHIFWNSLTQSWELIEQVPLPSTSLDVVGGALSYEIGSRIQDVLKSFVGEEVLYTEGAVTEANKATMTLNGVAALENVGLNSDGSTFGFDQDFRLFTFMNVPTVMDGKKVLKIRYVGKPYDSTGMATVIGVRNDNSVEALIVGGSPSPRDQTVSLANFKAFHLSMDAEVAADNPRAFITLSNEDVGEFADPQDAVKIYIDNQTQAVADVQTVLKDFLATNQLIKTVSSGGQNRTYGIDNQVYADPDEWNGSHHDLTTEGHQYMDVKMVVPRGNDPQLWAAIIGITADGQVTVLEEIMPLFSTKELLSKRYNVAGFERVTINYDRSNGVNTNPLIVFTSSGITFEENGVKKYVDRSISPLESVLSGFLYDNVEIYRQQWTGPPTVINGIAAQEGQLSLDNTLGNWTSPDSQYSAYFNIPTVVGGAKAPLVNFKGYEIGGVDYYANLIGIRPDGTNVPLIAATRSGDFTPMFLDRTFDISEFESISACFFTSAGTGDADQVLTFFTRQPKEEIPENAVKEYIGGGSEVTSEEMLYVDMPNVMPKIFIEGELPTDASDARTPTNVVVTYNHNNRNVFKVNAEMAIQGNWTVFENKKGYEFAFTNINGNAAKIQFGDWIPCDEFHFKAYPNDSSFTRDITAMKLWYNIRKSRPFPESYIADFKGPQGPDGTREDLLNQAIFYTDGFPTEMYLNGTFFGIFVWRLKKERDNYMIDRDNPNHVFLDNEDEINWTTFDHADWKVRSPRVSGYQDAGPINNPALMSKLNRWWGWFKGLDDGTVDYAATKDQFINEGSWVDAWISQQVTGHWDYQVNNMLLLSWDGLTLSVCFYDADQTWGWGNHGNTSGNIWWRSSFWMQKLYPRMLPAIRERYTWLRQNGVITMNEIHRLFMLSGGFISRDAYVREYANWPPTQGGNGKHTMRSSLLWAQNRLAQLDATWLLP